MKFSAARLLVLALMLLTLNSCDFGGSPSLGGTEGEGLTGILTDNHGMPAANMRVKVYPDSTLPLAKGNVVAPRADSTTTNGLGRFDFIGLVAGARYNLAASLSRGDTVFSIFIQDIVYAGGRQDLGSNTLMITGGITLRIQAGGSAPASGVLCRVPGSPFHGTVTDSGKCIIHGLPPGAVQIEIVAPGFQVTLTDALTVIQAVLSNGGTVNLIPEGATITPGTLVAWWDFEEGSGTQVLDKSGNGHNGTITGTAAWTTDGAAGKALTFNGATHVEVPASAAFRNLRSSFTLSAWTRQSDQGIRAPVMEFQVPGDYVGLMLWLNTSGNAANLPGSVFTFLRNAAGPAAPGNHFSTAGAVISANAWAHVAVAFDSTANLSRLYVNGVLMATKVLSPLSSPSTEGSLFMGWRQSTSLDSDRGMHFTGQMDEIRIYNQALSAAQIEGLYLRRGDPD